MTYRSMEKLAKAAAKRRDKKAGVEWSEGEEENWKPEKKNGPRALYSLAVFA